MRDLVSHSYKATGTNIFLYIIIFTFLDMGQEDEIANLMVANFP
jgi:hypothetical protein